MLTLIQAMQQQQVAQFTGLSTIGAQHFGSVVLRWIARQLGRADTKKTLSKPTDSLREKKQWILADLDLEPILIKAMDAEEGHGWALDFAYRVAQEYRRFLVLCLEYPQDPIVPSSLVDDFWHLHILDTQKYTEDCQHCFGSMLHHFPYFGMRGEKDAANLRQAWLKTLALYQSTFATAAPKDLWPHSNRCPNCGRRCAGVEDLNPTHDAFDSRRPRLADLGLSHTDSTDRSLVGVQ